MNKKWRRKFQEELTLDAARIQEEVNSDPNLKDVEAPAEMLDNIMRQIEEMKGEKAPVDTRLTAEEQELIRLGRVYQKRRRWNRYAIIAAAVVAMLAIGTTSLGGPKKVIEVVREFVNERERTNIDVDKDRVDEAKAQSEYETYLAIEDEFGCKAARMYYLPRYVYFSESVIDVETQNARFYYEDGKNEGRVLSYIVCVNHRSTSIGVDVEDEVLESYDIELEEAIATIKQYRVKGGKDLRWRVEFENPFITIK